MPRTTGLPWGLSLAAGIAVVVMTLGSQMAIRQQPTPLAFPSETETLKAREIAVDILGAPGTSLIAGKQGDTDGAGIDRRSPENNSSLLAPAKGGGTWTQKADMPTTRRWAPAAVVDGKIYVIGGGVDVVFDGVPEPLWGIAVEEYDPAADTWTTCANKPTSVHALGGAAVDGIVYAIGGWNESGQHSTVEAYDPSTDKWTKKARMPTPRSGLSNGVVAVDGKIYVIGGLRYPSILSTVEVYDPATDKWTRKADIPTARFDHAACVVDGRIYVSGGALAWPRTPTLSTVEVYDPATDTWTQASDMPSPRQDHSASVVDGKMYIIGGYDDAVSKLYNEGKLDDSDLEELFSIVYVYDPATDAWTTAARHPFPTTGHAAAVVDGRIYTMGGTRGDTHFSTVYEYDPSLSGNITIISPAGKLLRTWGEVKSE